jgi:hypothetical protein
VARADVYWSDPHEFLRNFHSLRTPRGRKQHKVYVSAFVSGHHPLGRGRLRESLEIRAGPGDRERRTRDSGERSLRGVDRPAEKGCRVEEFGAPSSEMFADRFCRHKRVATRGTVRSRDSVSSRPKHR